MSETTFIHETGCYSVCAPDISLLFHFPPQYLFLLLGEERVVWPEVLHLDGPYLLSASPAWPLCSSKCSSRKQSMCRKVTSWKWKSAKAKSTRIPIPVFCYVCCTELKGSGKEHLSQQLSEVRDVPLRVQLILKSKLFLPWEAVARQATGQVGLNSTLCPALPEMMLS